MAVPKFKEFYLPTLQFFEDGEIHTKKEVADYISVHFNLSETDLSERTSGGGNLKYKDRSGWAVDHLYRATLLRKISHGRYSISEEGINVLNDNIQSIDENFLKNYISFREYRNIDEAGEVEENEDDGMQSPPERLENAFNEINEDLALKILDEIMDNDYIFFENLVLDLLLKMGYGGFREGSGFVTSPTNDEGIDAIIDEDFLGLDKIGIQAKRHENNVGRPDIQKFSGALIGKGIKKGVFITTASFSQNAIQYVESLHETSIVLIDGKKLAKFMIEYDLGTSTTKTYSIKTIDSDYFNQDDI